MSFQRFYETWLEQLRQLVLQLRQALTPPSAEQLRQAQEQLRQALTPPSTEEEQALIPPPSAEQLRQAQEQLRQALTPPSTEEEQALIPPPSAEQLRQAPDQLRQALTPPSTEEEQVLIPPSAEQLRQALTPPSTEEEQALIPPSAEQLRQALTPPSAEEEHHRQIGKLVHEVISHYTDYYQSKSLTSKQDVLALFTATWTSSLERSLHWIAGWRPTTAFHILYTELNILFESHMMDILRGSHTGDLEDLSSGQLNCVSELQVETVQQEDAITHQLCDWQDDSSNVIDTMCDDINVKMERLVEIVEMADQLRLNTIKRLVELLTPQQAAEFLLVTADSHFGIRDWGGEELVW